MTTTDGLQKLEAWIKSREFAVEIYKNVLSSLPSEEKYNLSSQLRRAATSIPANIAEGYGRYYYQSNIQFCFIARGSLEETKTHLIIAHDVGYIDDIVFNHVIEKADKLLMLINGYIAYLRRAKHGENDNTFQKMIKEDEVIYN
ncbi:four helix bundle protein, partial [bacterium]|nr:four helix bundle protein [bacterium]